MSRDANATYIHLHASHHADLFEEFCHPPSTTNTSNTSNSTSNTNQAHQPSLATNAALPSSTTDNSGLTTLPGHFLPFEEIFLPSHLMPVNPEDEDGVVPDMHAAFGINAALGQGGVMGVNHGTGEGSGRGVQREEVWRDLGVEALVDGYGHQGEGGGGRLGGGVGVNGNGVSGGSGTVGGPTRARREGTRTNILLMR